MLRRIRIEVEEETAEACVEALWKYEHALVQQEVRRYRYRWPVSLVDEPEIRDGAGQLLPINTAELDAREYPTPDQPWSDDIASRSFANEQLGRELHEEVIEFDEGLPGYRGRRVVSYTRVDTRLGSFVELEVSGPQVGWHVTGTVATTSP